MNTQMVTASVWRDQVTTTPPSSPFCSTDALNHTTNAVLGITLSHTRSRPSKAQTAPFQTPAHARSVLENVLVCLTVGSPLATVHGGRHVDAEVRRLL